MNRSVHALRRGRALLLALSVVLTAIAAPAAHAGSWVYGAYGNLWGARSYQVWVPTGYQPGHPLPLVVALHGCFQNPDQFAGLARLNQKADAEGFLVLYPNQAVAMNPSQCWNFMLAVNQERGIGEPSIIMGMVGWVRSHYSVDAHRIYVGGVSAGAVMTSILLACYSDVFAAGMVGAGAMYKAATTIVGSGYTMLAASPYSPDARGKDAWACSGKARRKVGVLVIHGTADPIVNPANGEQAVQQFLQTNDYGDDGVDNDSVAYQPTAVWTGVVPGGRAFTVKDFVYDGSLLVQKWEIGGGGHAWPGGDAGYLFADPDGPDATAIMWNFFEQHTR